MINYWLSDHAFGPYLKDLSPELMAENRVSPGAAEAAQDVAAEKTPN